MKQACLDDTLLAKLLGKLSEEVNFTPQLEGNN
jgi:hypothetical protein